MKDLLQKIYEFLPDWLKLAVIALLAAVAALYLAFSCTSVRRFTKNCDEHGCSSSWFDSTVIERPHKY